MKDWWIYRGTGGRIHRHTRLSTLEAPPWRDFQGEGDDRYDPPGTQGPAWERTERRGSGYVPDEDEIDAVNTALYLRRPLLVTGKPGVGKSTLAYSIAADLGLGPVLHWPITSRTTLRDGLYLYDAISRLQDANLHQMHMAVGERLGLETLDGEAGSPDQSIAGYLRLGPLGTALLPQEIPRVLLIDEIDKSDIDLPGDLLTVFEDGEFEIPELVRIAARQPSVSIATDDGPDRTARIARGRVRCQAFPVVVLTSNGERDFPPPFLRRCIRLELSLPGREKLEQIVRERLGVAPGADDEFGRIVGSFLDLRADGDLATDQLLNAIQLRLSKAWSDPDDRQKFLDRVLHRLTGPSV